jgi:hypothetical protein
LVIWRLSTTTIAVTSRQDRGFTVMYLGRAQHHSKDTHRFFNDDEDEAILSLPGGDTNDDLGIFLENPNNTVDEDEKKDPHRLERMEEYW